MLSIIIFFSMDMVAAKERLIINACGVVRVAFMKELSIAFMKKYKVPIAMNKKGGDIGTIGAIYNKNAQLGVGCRVLNNEDEIEKTMKYIQVAWGALAFLVNKDNPIDNITLEQVKGIITGKIRNWKELGGEDEPIHFYLRKAGNRTGVGYSARIILLGNKNAKFYKPSSDLLKKSSGEIREAVIQDKYGFGIGDVMSAKRVKGLKLLKLNGVTPTKKTILEQKYLGFRPYFFYFPKDISPLAEKFKDFALSKEGQAIISKAGTANLEEGLANLDEGIVEGDQTLRLSDDEAYKETQDLKMYACGVTRVAFMKELNEAFGKKFNVKISMNKKGGDLFVIKGVHTKETDIGSGCRNTLKNVKSEKDLWSTQVAWGALSFIVHPKNKIDNISTDNIKKILKGKIINWKELGGANKPIHLIVRESKRSGIGLTARELLFNDINMDFYKKAKKVKSSGFVRKAVAEDENSFAIDNIISSSKDHNIKLLKVDGIEATKENILSDKYKLRQALYFYLNKKPKKLAKKYIDFALSKEGQSIISKTGTANLEEATGKKDKMNMMFQKLKFQIKSK